MTRAHSKWIKQINIWEVSVKHCPTEVMWSDTLMKPNQGSVCWESRKKLMNIDKDCGNQKKKCKDTNAVSRQCSIAEILRCNLKRMDNNTNDRTNRKEKQVIRKKLVSKGLYECVGEGNAEQVCALHKC